MLAVEWWPSSAVPGELSVELPVPAHFEQAIERVRPEDVTSQVICGPDLDRYVEAVRKYVDGGYDHVYLHQVGPDQKGFLEWASRELLPGVRDGAASGAGRKADTKAKAGSRR